MEIKTNFSLKNHNTFGIDVPAARFVTTETLEELRTACSTFGEFLVLGGGSNILLTRPVEIPVIHVALKGIEIIHENEDIVKVAVAAGKTGIILSSGPLKTITAVLKTSPLSRAMWARHPCRT